MYRTKIAIYILGGHISLYKDPITNGVFGVEKKEHIEQFIPEAKNYEIKVFSLPIRNDFKRLEDWEILYNAIKKKANLFDGFLVLHEGDTLIFGSSLLSYMCKDFYKPILFVTSPEFLSKKQSCTGVQNIKEALLTVEKDLGEVGIISKGKIIRAVRCRRKNVCDLTPFYSEQIDDIGEVKEGKIVLSLHRYNKLHSQQIQFPYTFPKIRIQLIRIYPGMSASSFYKFAKHKDISGIFIQTLGYGSIPKKLFEAIVFLQETGVQVVILAEHDSDLRTIHMDIDMIASTRICVLKNIPIWPAFAKMHVALANTNTSIEFKKFMENSIRGDLIQ